MNPHALHRRSLSLWSCLLLAPDGGAGGGGGGDAGDAGGGDAGGGDAGAGAGAGGEAGGDAGGADAPVNLSQQQLDALISKRIGAARAGWERDLNAYSDQENETATQKAEREAAEARQQAEAATTGANATLRRAEATVQAGLAGIRPDRIAAALAIAASDAEFHEVEVNDSQVDSAAMAKILAKVAKAYPEFTSQAAAGAAGASTTSANDAGGNPSATAPKSMQDAVAARLAKAMG